MTPFLRGIAIVGLFQALANYSQPTTSVQTYLPLALGNEWTYIIRMADQPPSFITWKVMQRDLIKGAPVFYLEATPSDGDEPYVLTRTGAGIAEFESDRVVIKYPVVSGAHWSSKSERIGQPVGSDALEIVSAGKPCKVGDHTFNDCIVIREVDSAIKVRSLTTYADGVGAVQYVYLNYSKPDKVISTMTIKSWKLKGAV